MSSGSPTPAMPVTKQRAGIRLSATLLFGVVAGMLALSFASVPLYRMFCQVTGYAGTPRTENVAAPSAVAASLVTVEFDANVNSALPWQFKPLQRRVRVHPGEEVLVHYTARNTSEEPVTGTATFNVSPDTAAKYFNKMECFCFTEQELKPGEAIEMPVVFYVDPDILTDPETADITKITLSYTFFRIGDEEKKTADGRPPASGQPARGDTNG